MTTVLIVDDEPSLREMVIQMIESTGYDVIEAGNGIEANNVCKETAVDLIITDIIMPGKNGIELIVDVKKEHPDIPILAISGGGSSPPQTDILDVAKLLGANNILKKPFSMDDLLSSVNSIINNERQA